MCGQKITLKNLPQSREWLIVIGLSLLVILLRLPSLEHPFDNDSAANAYHARLILRGEPLYSTHHPAHHLPAVYYTYALAFLLFGDTLWAVKFLLMLWTIATVYLLYRLGALLLGKAEGLLAAIFYAILSAHLWLWGNSAQIELFANLPRIAAFFVLIYLTQLYPLNSPLAATWKFVFVGWLSAVAFLFKAIYLSPLILASLVLLIDLWPNRATAGAWRDTLMRGLWMGLGFVIEILIVAGYFAFLGLWPRLWLVFTLGQAYTHNSGSLQYTIFYPLVGLAYNNLALLTFSLTALIIIIVGKTRRTLPLVLVALWYMLSFVEAGALVGVFRFYYYLLIIPPLALLAGWFLLKIYHDIDEEIKRPGIVNSFASGIIASSPHRLAPSLPLPNPWRAPLILAILLAITLTISIIQNFNFY